MRREEEEKKNRESGRKKEKRRKRRREDKQKLKRREREREIEMRIRRIEMHSRRENEAPFQDSFSFFCYDLDGVALSLPIRRLQMATESQHTLPQSKESIPSKSKKERKKEETK